MNTYYRLISFQGALVVFTDSRGKQNTYHIREFLNNGLLEFFQDDATRILAHTYIT